MQVRRAAAKDMDAIYMMGFDAWSGGVNEAQYLQACRQDTKYKKGEWHVLENGQGQPVSSLICYKGLFGLIEGSVGIGSLCTVAEQRRNGYAIQLLRHVAEQIGKEAQHIFLYADIAPAFYEKLGFAILEDRFQKHKPSLCMARGDITKVPYAPSYF